ncbi:MAG: hypothetical protein HRU20_26950 [Pseudomonadales bacterium]|nr:hypothetical protein [Pseudomonadales bacterium]
MPRINDSRFTMYAAWKPDRQIFIRNLTMIHMMHRDDVDKLLKHAWLKQMMMAFIVDFSDKIDDYGDTIKYDSNGWNNQFSRYIYNRYRASKTFNDTVPKEQRKQYSYDPQHKNVRDLMGEKPVEPSTVQRHSIPETVDADAFMRWIDYQQEKNAAPVSNSYFNECLSLFSHIPKDEQSFRVSNCVVGGYTKPWVKMNESARQAKSKYLDGGNTATGNKKARRNTVTSTQHQNTSTQWQPNADLMENPQQGSIPAMNFAGEHSQLSGESIDLKALQRWVKHRERNKYAVIDEQAIAEQLSKIPKKQQAEAVSYSIAGDYKQVFQPGGKSGAKGQPTRHSFMALARGEHLQQIDDQALPPGQKQSSAQALNSTAQLAQQFDKLRLQQKDKDDE